MTDTTAAVEAAIPAHPYRGVASHAAMAEDLGPLADLPGIWEGTGFSLIARPDYNPDNPDGFFLQLNLLRESIEFRSIGSPVMNRGSQQEDIALFGVTYLHRVTDAVTGAALHIEPGAFLVIPPTSAPEAGESIARLCNIPHGNSVCAVGFAQSEVPQGMPQIPPANTVPFDIGGEAPPPGTPNPYAAYDLSKPTPFRTSPLPAGITQAMVDDPLVMVREALEGQHMTHVTRLITAAGPEGVGNIPFVTQNVDTTRMTSVFAIERIARQDGSEFMQMQYDQTALLNFRGKSFPHVTVGTLVKAF